MQFSREFIGEFLGTFVLVIFGCGAVAVSVLFDAHKGLMQISMAWGVAVTLAIYLTRHLSCAHLNPAVSIAMVIGGRMAPRKLPVYLIAQFTGAFLAGLIVYFLFEPSITFFENTYNILRGSEESIKTAMIFGEYYPNPGCTAVVSFPLAVGAETFGTFLLVLMIFGLTEGCNVGRPDNSLTPVFVGLTLTTIICLIAPFTQAGLNPARDFGPRMVAWFFGWGDVAFPDHIGGFFYVYICGPIMGGLFASFFFIRLLEPLLKGNSALCNCEKGSDSDTGSEELKCSSSKIKPVNETAD